MKMPIARLPLRLWALLAVLSVPTYALATQDFGVAFELEPARYVGFWYELARTPNSFEDNRITRSGVEYGPCFNASATYEVLSSDRISVLNQCTRAATNGSSATVEEDIEGVGRIQRDSGNRKLKIAFGNAFVRFFFRLFTGGGADYWVYGLGPVGADGLYQWALVSGPARDSIFVLTREPDVDAAVLGEILRVAEAEGLPTEQLIFTQQ